MAEAAYATSAISTPAASSVKKLSSPSTFWRQRPPVNSWKDAQGASMTNTSVALPASLIRGVAVAWLAYAVVWLLADVFPSL